MYGKNTTSFLIVLLTPLIYVVGEFPPFADYFFFAVSGISLFYLFLGRPEESGAGGGTRLLPGHYLLLLILVLQSSLGKVSFALWTVLILVTLGYSYLIGKGSFQAGLNYEKLTTSTLYCTIWGVVFFFVQKILITGLGIQGLKGNLLRLGVGLAGFLYIAVGIYRMNKNQRRFTI